MQQNRFTPWLQVRPEGLYCNPAQVFIDPVVPVDRAVITHAHSDHARPGHSNVLATVETLRLMQTRLGGSAFGSGQALALREPIQLNDVTLWLAPAGHVLGSAQVVLEFHGQRAVVSGDYKTVSDPTAERFEPVPCDLFVTEATFGLPVFRHPPALAEVGKLLRSLELFAERSHVVGCYALGKTQRLISLLRLAGYDRPIYLHGALLPVCEVYRGFGIDLGELLPATGPNRAALAGAVVLAPPSAIQDRWARRLADPVVAMASGWMRVRQRAKARGVELPMILSDHADWDELLATIEQVGAGEVWVTHGREEALIHALSLRGVTGRALALLGYGEEEDAVGDAVAVRTGEIRGDGRSSAAGHPA